MRKSIVRAAIAAVGLVSAAGFAGAAQATDFSIDTTVSDGKAWVIDPPGWLTGTIHDSNTGTNENVYIGTIQLKGDYVNQSGSGDLRVFCIDIHDNLGPGVFMDRSAAELADVHNDINVHYSAQQVTDLTKFLAYVDQTGVTDAFSSAVAQLGVWEIISEASNTNWDVTTGAFKVDISSDVQIAANAWLAASKTTSAFGYQLHVLDPAGGNQTQAFVTHGGSSEINEPGVPEPATWGMIVLGFGLLGSSLRRRKQEEMFA